MATKRIKFLKAWNMFGVGAEMDLNAPIADLLIQRGRAEEVKATSDLVPPEKAHYADKYGTLARKSKRQKRSPRLKGK